MPKPKEVQQFIETLQDCGYEPKSYSGRGMFGKSCVAISGDKLEGLSAWEVARRLWFNNLDEAGDLDVPEPRQDSLGLGIVLYWPSYEWPEDENA